MQYGLYCLAFIVALTGCAESVKHDEVSAGKRALEFAQIVFVKQDLKSGYAMLSEGTRRYVSLEQFKDVLAKLHPRAFPTEITATEYEPVAGEKIIYIFLTGENSGEHFYYRLAMEGTAATGYRVLRIYRGNEPYPPSSDKQKFKSSMGPPS